MWPWYFLLLLLIAGVAAGAWWLGTGQQQARPPELPAEEPLGIPVSEVQQPALDPAQPEPLPAPAPAPAIAPPARTAEARPPAPQKESTARSSEAARKAERKAPERTGRTAGRADPKARSVAAPGPAPPVLTEQQRNRGRVVQLGAFPTRAQADTAWRRITRRYPYLATKPKMVNTVEVRPLGGGRGTRMYRLQLGTSSQAQSAVICQQLERARQSCVVVY